MTSQAMTTGRAFAINARLVDCWFIRGGIQGGVVPSLTGITLADAQEATRIVCRHQEQMASGGRVVCCTVAPDMLPRLYAWAVLDRQDTILRG